MLERDLSVYRKHHKIFGTAVTENHRHHHYNLKGEQNEVEKSIHKRGDQLIRPHPIKKGQHNIYQFSNN